MHPVALTFTNIELDVCLLFLKPLLRCRHSSDTSCSHSCTLLFFLSLWSVATSAASSTMVNVTKFHKTFLEFSPTAWIRVLIAIWISQLEAIILLEFQYILTVSSCKHLWLCLSLTQPTYIEGWQGVLGLKKSSTNMGWELEDTPASSRGLNLPDTFSTVSQRSHSEWKEAQGYLLVHIPFYWLSSFSFSFLILLMLPGHCLPNK